MKKQLLSQVSLAVILLGLAAASAHAQIVSLPVEDPTFSTPVVGDGSEGFIEGSHSVAGIPTPRALLA